MLIATLLALATALLTGPLPALPGLLPRLAMLTLLTGPLPTLLLSALPGLLRLAMLLATLMLLAALMLLATLMLLAALLSGTLPTLLLVALLLVALLLIAILLHDLNLP